MASDTRLRLRKRAFVQARNFRRNERRESTKLRTLLYYEVGSTDSKLNSLKRDRSKLESKLQDLQKTLVRYLGWQSYSWYIGQHFATFYVSEAKSDGSSHSTIISTKGRYCSKKCCII